MYCYHYYLHNGIGQLSHGHAPTEACGSVAIRDIGDQFEAKLAGIEHSQEEFVGRACSLHGSLDHDPGVQDLPQQPGHNAGPGLVWQEGNTVWAHCEPA